MRKFREHLSFSQQQLAVAISGTKRAIQDNEAGKTAPNSRALRGLLLLGADLNWLLSGRGRMILDVDEAPMAQNLPVNTTLLRFVIGTIDKECRVRAQSLPSDKYAEVATILYEFCVACGRQDDTILGRLLNVAVPTADGK